MLACGGAFLGLIPPVFLTDEVAILLARDARGLRAPPGSGYT